MKFSTSTNIDQSHRLMQCGLDANTADMLWRRVYDPISDSYEYKEHLLVMKYDTAKTIYGEKDVTPAWGLSVLLALMPETITQGKTIFYLDFAPYDNKGWGFGYFNSTGIRSIKGLTNPCDPIEAAVRLIEWLKGNGYSLNTIIDSDNEKEN